MESNDVVCALAALAQSSRLGIFRALVQAGPAGLTPGDLSAQLEVAGNTLSFHLKELMHADLVSQERAGRNLIYRAPEIGAQCLGCLQTSSFGISGLPTW